MNKPAVSQAKMNRMRKVIEGAGLPFRGFRTNPDGSVEALVGEPEGLTPANANAQPSADDEFAAWASQHGYG